MEKNTDLVLVWKKKHGQKNVDLILVMKKKDGEKCRFKILRKDSTLDLGMFII